MLYRAQDKAGTSRLGYAESNDGLNFTRLPNPVLSPATDYEAGGGIEDPRLVKIGDTYYLTYTGYNKKDAQLCLAVSKDLQSVGAQRRHSSCIPWQVERRMDEIRGDRTGQD